MGTYTDLTGVYEVKGLFSAIKPSFEDIVSLVEFAILSGLVESTLSGIVFLFIGNSDLGAISLSIIVIFPIDFEEILI